MRAQLFPSMCDIPEEMFMVLIDRLTYWKLGWAMRPTAERLRKAAASNPVAVAFENTTPIGWVLVETLVPIVKLQMFVAKDYRKRGVATALVRSIRQYVGKSKALSGYQAGVFVIDAVLREDRAEV